MLTESSLRVTYLLKYFPYNRKKVKVLYLEKTADGVMKIKRKASQGKQQ